MNVWIEIASTVVTNASYFFGGYFIGKSHGFNKTIKKIMRDAVIEFHKENTQLAKNSKLMDISKMTWRCMVCNETRANSFISVKTHDLDDDGICKINVKYCNDKSNCRDIAHILDKWKLNK